MKVLFLDIDEVLNSSKTRQRFGIDYIEPEKCEHLNQICQDTGTSIVVSSDWRIERIYGYGKTIIALQNAGFTVPIVGCTPEHDWLKRAHPRSGEIRAWLDSHPEVQTYAILDDLDIIGHGRHFVRVGRQGLDTSHYRRLREILS